MDLLNIQRRLTEHLAQEASSDFHTTEARADAIQEAYEYISEKWALNLAAVPSGGAEGTADFFSYAPHKPGYYNKRPPMLAGNSEPWNGKYPQLHRLISYYAAFCLYRDKGPEMYERSQYWLNLFNEMATAAVERTLNREHIKELSDGDADSTSYLGLRKMVRLALDLSSLTQEQAHRLFPDNLIKGTIQRVYREITIELELNSRERAYPVPVGLVDVPGAEFTVDMPADFLSPISRVAVMGKGEGLLTSLPYPNTTDDVGLDLNRYESGAQLLVSGHASGENVVRLQYVAAPPELSADTDRPWRGMYPLGENLLYRRVMRELLRSHTQTQEVANLWAQESEVAYKSFVDSLRNQDIDSGEATGETFGGLIRLIQFYLDTTDLSPEKARRYFPTNVREGAIIRAYREITEKYELSVKTAAITLNPPQESGEEMEALIPADFLAPKGQIAYVGTRGVVGAEYPYGPASTYAPSFSVAVRDGRRYITVQNGGRMEGELRITYIAAPPPLVNQTDKPWDGAYPVANKLIALLAMKDLCRGKKELYQLSRFWQNEYDREEKDVKQHLKKYTLGQANRVMWGHSSTGISDYVMNINWPDKLKNYVEWM